MPNVGSFTKSGIRNLSELNIDTDKNWKHYKIYNLKSVVQTPAQGRLFVQWQDVEGNTEIIQLPSGEYGQVLVSGGPGAKPFFDWGWGAPGLKKGLERSFYIDIYTEVHKEGVTVDKTIEKEVTQEAVLGTNQGPNESDFKEQTSNTATEIDASTITPDDVHEREATVEAVMEYSVS
ncbi:MAG: hypothetical protein DRP81_06050 [Candidatus Omnitrophota bacterium]|nr:MAG: hypothetical protein DRP81_06050 [Candidatus Omnitrophota bacterium]